MGAKMNLTMRFFIIMIIVFVAADIVQAVFWGVDLVPRLIGTIIAAVIVWGISQFPKFR